MKISMIDDTLNVFSHLHHTVQEALNTSLDFCTSGLVYHLVIYGGTEADNSLQSILASFAIHFLINALSRFLCNTDLCLNNHVVNYPDESSEGLLVHKGKTLNSVFEGIFLLLEHHRFVF